MGAFVLKRFAQAIVSLLLMSIFIFLLVRLTGDPGHVLLPLDATPEMYEHLEKEMGLDKPLVVQWVKWTGKMIRGDFGTSMARHVPVTQLMWERFPATLMLAAAGFLSHWLSDCL